MNPKNFPERKNQKRKDAYKRLVKKYGNSNPDAIRPVPENIQEEICSLHDSISKDSLREKRTKIFRGQN